MKSGCLAHPSTAALASKSTRTSGSLTKLKLPSCTPPPEHQSSKYDAREQPQAVSLRIANSELRDNGLQSTTRNRHPKMRFRNVSAAYFHDRLCRLCPSWVGSGRR